MMAEYDIMGNYTGFDNYQPAELMGPQFYDDFGNPVANAEEAERRRKEAERQIEEYRRQQEELGSQVTNKQEVTTYADGSQTITTKREVPGKQPLQPVAPVQDQTAYNQRIAQQESGGRQDIGYHNQQLSSAYGPYGITQAAYQDARRRDPSLPADIRQATPAQMTAAQNAVTSNNARYLQNYGVPVNEKTLSAAHFLGAKGLADYLRDGTISPQAARANGGADRVRQIVNARLGGRPAAASGAAQPVAPGALPMQTRPAINQETGEVYQEYVPENERIPLDQPFRVTVPMSSQPPAAQPQAQPAQAVQPVAPTAAQPAAAPADQAQPTRLQEYIQRYQDLQNDPIGLMSMGTDDNAPEFLRNRARNRFADLITEQREEQKAQEKLATATPTDLARYLQGKVKSGEDYQLATRIRAMLFNWSGNKELAMREMNKLDTGTDKYVQGADGKSYLVKQKANGEIISGYSAETGKELAPDELVKVGAGTAGAAKLNIVGGSYVNDKTGEVGRLISDERTGQSYIQTDTGRKPMAGFRPQGQAGTMDMQAAQQIQKQNLELQVDWAKLQMRVQGAAPEAANRFIGEFNAKHGTNFGIQNISGAAPQISMETRQMIQPAPTAAQPMAQPMAQPAAVSQAAPAAQPAQPAARPQAAAPVVPGSQPAVQPAAQPAQAARPAPVSPADLESQREREKREREAGLEVQTTEQKEFVKETKPLIGQTASDGQAVSNARRQQLDIIRRNPSIVNIMNGQGSTYDQARRIIINAASGAYGQEERQQLATDLSQVMNKLTEAEQGALQEFVNLNTVVNAKTLRANAGPGAVSDAEQRANKEANVGNVDRIPAYAALAGLHRSQFNGDLAASKQSFLEKNPQLKTTGEFNSAWQKQEALRLKEYQAIAKARFDIMGRAPATNAGPEAIAAYRDRVFRAFEAYPAPTFDPTTGRWNYQTANARRAAMAAVLGQ